MSRLVIFLFLLCFIIIEEFPSRRRKIVRPLSRHNVANLFNFKSLYDNVNGEWRLPTAGNKH